MAKRPVIGITGPDKGGGAAWLFTAISVIMAGGKPVRIRPEKPMGAYSLDALILGGGADIEPMKYGQQRIDKKKKNRKGRSLYEWILSVVFFPVYWAARYLQHTKSSPVDERRDELEFGLIEAAMEKEIPVLGICRGMQLLNVHFKGSLHQDISGYYAEKSQVSSIFPKKKVLISDGSMLADILHTDACNVNALHNQAIDRAGEGLKLVAREANTQIWQAVEHPDYPFVLGVQWHPEYLIQVRRQRQIFRKLVQAAEAVKSRTSWQPYPEKSLTAGL